MRRKFFLILSLIIVTPLLQPQRSNLQIVKVSYFPKVEIPSPEVVYKLTTDVIPMRKWLSPRNVIKSAVDRILIKKSRQMLLLMAGERVIKKYLISLGFSPQGHKERAGDGKTPEGKYYINGRNPQSRYHRALKISYPNAEDIARARVRGVDPGGDIMIHGIEKKLCYLGKSHVTELWTRGCVVVTNREMDEIWNLVSDGTLVEIQA